MSLLALLAAPAVAAPYTPWGAMTGEGVVALSPYLTLDPASAAMVSPYVLAGLGDTADVLVGGSVGVGGAPLEAVPGALELMPRLALADALILATHVSWVPGADSATLGLEAHGTARAGDFGFTWNGGWRGDTAEGPGEAFAVLAPELWLTDRVTVFSEVNPVARLDGGVGATFVPGASALLKADGSQSITVAVPVVAAGADTAVSLGAVWWWAFDTSGRRPQAVDADSVASSETEPPEE